MTRWILVAIGAAAALLLGSSYVCSPVPTANAQQNAGLGLSGKPVLVLAKEKIGYTLEKVEVRQLGGRAFIVGREVKESPHRLTNVKWGGSTVWIPVDSITEMVELEPIKAEKK